MALANSKDKDEQATRERARAAMEAYPNKSAELKQILVLKGRHLDVDGVLSRSFKDVKLTSPALNQQSLSKETRRESL